MTSLVVVRVKKKGSWVFSVVVRKKSTQVLFGGGVLGVGSASHSVNIWAFELILLFTSVDGLFCLGPRETITTSTVETLYSYPEKQLLLVQWRHSTASGSS